MAPSFKDKISNIDSLIGCLLFYAETNPHHDAVVTPSFKLSYSQLAQLVKLQVNKFKVIGISSDTVIGIKCADETQHLVFCLAAAYTGAMSCTIPLHEAAQTQFLLNKHCGTIYLVDETLAVNLKALDDCLDSTPVEPNASESRFLFSTSGTTGDPKLVVHHDSDLVHQAHRHIGSELERFACLASMEHNFAKRHRLYCVAVGATNVFLESSRDTLLSQIQSLNVNVMHVSAFQAQELLAIPGIGKLSNIRLKLGGSHVPLALRQQLRDNITSELQAGYGTTETGAIAFTDPKDLQAAESVGQPLPGIELRLVTSNRNTASDGEQGELAIRCDGMFRQYLGKPELTAARLDKDGWFYTGDIGYLDKQQRIHLCGRSDDMFVFNSMNIFPQDIESRICDHPDIIDAAVFSKTSSVHGDIPVALIVFAENIKIDLPALKKFVLKQVGLRSPRQFTVVNEIPRNSSGKISRNEVKSLAIRNDQIRQTIVEELGANLTRSLKPSRITSFENGEGDISLSDIELDSLARMGLLVAVETLHNIVITPQEFAQFNSLGDMVARLLSPAAELELESNSNVSESHDFSSASRNDTAPFVVRFFQRIFSYCHTVAHLNKALNTLEHRLTPLEVECLNDWQLGGHLISTNAPAKFGTAITNWLHNIKQMMMDSQKHVPEPFASNRLAASVTHFIGGGSSADKTLLICFSPRGSRQLMIPNCVLMQHTDSNRYDLLVIAEPMNEGYLQGIPTLGKNMTEVAQWTAKLSIIGNYKQIRTLGCSAGGYAAVVAAYLLGAEMAVCIGGRFHSERYPRKILARLFTTWQAVRKGHCANVIMSYGIDKGRDRNYAKIIGWMSSASQLAVEFTDGHVGHLVIERLRDRGELAPYLARTIFTEMNEELITTQGANLIMSFPSTQIRHCSSPK